MGPSFVEALPVERFGPATAAEMKELGNTFSQDLTSFDEMA
jgi:hypothetical protein